MWAPRPGPGIATHHLDLSELTLDQSIRLLERSETDPYHAIRVFKISLLAAGDDVVDLLEWLGEDRRKVRHASWVSSALQERHRRRKSDVMVKDESMGEGSSCTAGPSVQSTRLPLRVITLSNHKLTQKGYDAFAELIAMHGSLTTLDLTLNTLAHPLPSLRSLSQGASQSLLRKLVLSDTRLSIDAFCELVDNLDAPCLHELRLSLTLPPRGMISREDSQRAALSVARLLRVKKRKARWRDSPTMDADEDGDGPSCEEACSGGSAPQLEVLTLNGNHLTLPGVKMIVAAAVGGPASPPNRILTHVELFATCESDERDEDEEQEDDAEARGRSGSNGEAHRTLSVFRGYRAARKAAEGTAGRNVSSPAGDLLSPQDAARVHGTQTDRSEGLRRETSQAQYEPDERRSYAHITAENWRRKLGAHLWQNTGQRSSVIHAAQQVVGKARILGCKSSSVCAALQSRSSDTGKSSSPLALEGLPPELRLAILRQLDSDRVLSEEQFRLIVSWACDSSTIGYGREGVPLPWAHHAGTERGSSSQPPMSAGRTAGLLPAAPWDWHDMLSRSLPRDWVAESWDLWNEHKDTIPIMGGGGGPDGEGGATEPVTRGGGRPGGLVARGSLDRRAPDPGLLAFLEATGTRARQD